MVSPFSKCQRLQVIVVLLAFRGIVSMIFSAITLVAASSMTFSPNVLHTLSNAS